jgi:hypothetical protein
VPELVGDDGAQLVGRERIEVGEPEHEVVARPEDAGCPRNLNDARVRVTVDPHLVDVWAADQLPHLVDHPEELGRLAALHPDAGRRRKLHVQRPDDHEEESADRNQELQEQAGAAEGRDDDQDCKTEKEEDQEADEDVTERR